MRSLAGLLFALGLALAVVAQEPVTPPEQPAPVPASSSAAANPAPAQSNNATTPPAAEAPQQPSQIPPPPPGTPVTLSGDGPKQLAEARRVFDAGMKLKSSGNLDAAFEKFERAAELAPRNVDFVTAREFTRQQLVMLALQRGNKAMLEHKDIVAMADFRQALEYDPTNDFAQQRLRDSISSDRGESRNLRMVDNSTQVEIQPNDSRHDFHYRGDARTLLTQVAQAYGITVVFDDSVSRHHVRFDIQDVNFATAMEAATQVTKAFWVPLSAKQMFLAADTLMNRRSFERMSLRTFYLTNLVTPADLVELQNALRIVLDLRFIVQDPTEATITIRAPQSLLDAAAQIIASINVARPEVLLDMNVYEVSYSLLRQLGNNVNTQWTLTNITPALVASLTGGASTNLINQLISSGGINQGNSQAIQALLSQLQQSNQSSLLSTPMATFGGGLTLFGLAIPGFTVNLNLNESDVRSLQHVILRTTQNNAAIMKIGERYPIINATYAPIYNSAAISQVLGNQSYIAPFPSFNFEDLGLNLKATPMIHSDKSITLKMELQIRSLGTATNNGQPIINNREYNGTITLKDGEEGLVAGLISKADSRSLMGYPFLAQVPGLSYGISEHDKNVTDDDLLVVITPHIIRLPEEKTFALQLPVGH